METVKRGESLLELKNEKYEMNCSAIIFSRHVFHQMIERNISDEEVKEVVKQGEVIKEYPEDKPYKSWLLFKFVKQRPIHVVISKDENGRCIVITAYEPNPAIWQKDFKTKK